MLRLTALGRVLTQPLTIRMDPRVRATPAALAQQFAAATRLAAAMRRDYDALQAVRALRSKIAAARKGAVTDSLDRQLAEIESGGRGPTETLTRLNGELAGLLDVIDGVDAAPTTQAARAVTTLEAKLVGLLARWNTIRRRAAGLTELR